MTNEIPGDFLKLIVVSVSGFVTVLAVLLGIAGRLIYLDKKHSIADIEAKDKLIAELEKQLSECRGLRDFEDRERVARRPNGSPDKNPNK